MPSVLQRKLVFDVVDHIVDHVVLGLDIEPAGTGNVGSITDKIKGLSIDESHPADSRSITGKLEDLEIEEEDKSADFQRKRSVPPVKGWN